MKYLSELMEEELPKDAQAGLTEVETPDFIRQGRNVLLYGNPGTGKTHLATALGIKACRQDFSVLFTSVPTLLTQLREAKSNKTLLTLQLRFEKYDPVICDEFGYVGCDKEGGELLFNQLSLRAGKKPPSLPLPRLLTDGTRLSGIKYSWPLGSTDSLIRHIRSI
jgi:DNA replication protein DnaC